MLSSAFAGVGDFSQCVFGVFIGCVAVRGGDAWLFIFLISRLLHRVLRVFARFFFILFVFYALCMVLYVLFVFSGWCLRGCGV